jgi:hypothetical protein
MVTDFLKLFHVLFHVIAFKKLLIPDHSVIFVQANDTPDLFAF